MAQWDNRDVDAEATKIAKAHLASSQGDLTALAVKVARDHGLNQEQIRRLCRATNVKMFEEKFAEASTGGDRVPEYDPVDAESVIHALYKDAATPTKTAAARYPRIEDELASHRHVGRAPPVREKSAEDHYAAIARAFGKDVPLDRQLMRLTKVAEELRIQSKAAELVWKTNMDDLLAASRGLYWDHDAFEKDAVALHGLDVLPELNALRGEKQLAALEIPTEKVAELQDRLLGTETDHVRRLKAAADARQTCLHCGAALASTAAKLADVRKAVTRG